MSYKRQSEERVSNPRQIPDGVYLTIVKGRNKWEALSHLFEMCEFHIIREVHHQNGMVTLEVYWWIA